MELSSKQDSDYDLTRLFIGSEGTLGLNTDVKANYKDITMTTFETIRDAAQGVQARQSRGGRQPYGQACYRDGELGERRARGGHGEVQFSSP